MRCAGCRRDLDVGDQFIQFTASEWAEREGMKPLAGLDDLLAGIMDSGHGDKLVYCEDCTQRSNDDGWLFDTVYGDEDDSASSDDQATPDEPGKQVSA